MQTVCNTFWDAGKGNLTAQNTRKPFGGRGSAPDPAEEAYSAPANPLVGGEGLAVPSPRTPSLALGPSGLASSTPTPKLVATPLDEVLQMLDPAQKAAIMWTHGWVFIYKALCCICSAEVYFKAARFVCRGPPSQHGFSGGKRSALVMI